MADPRISVAQGAQILGKTCAQVYRLVRFGRRRRRGEPNKFRGLLLSDVLQYRDRGDPILAMSTFSGPGDLRALGL